MNILFFVVVWIAIVVASLAVFLFDRSLKKEDAREKLANLLGVAVSELPSRFLEEVKKEIRKKVDGEISTLLAEKERLVSSLEGTSGANFLLYQLKILSFEESFKRLRLVKRFFLS